MKILTFNLNGIRSASRKGFFDWLADRAPTIDACLFQELKADESEMPLFTDKLLAMGFSHAQWHCALQKGYAGTGLCSKELPDAHHQGFGVDEFDREGRLCHASYGQLHLASAYFPSGSAGAHRQESKMRFLQSFRPWLDTRAALGGHSLIGADLNVAHRNLDLKNWKGNIEAPGCTSAERSWMDQWLSSGWRDTARELRPTDPFYTWWSPRAGSRARDVGWRIDAHICTPILSMSATGAVVEKEPAFSDHGMLIIEYDGSFAHWSRGLHS
jgi:exodeoxyribonuclease-3